MSVQAPNAERQIWIYTQMLRVREFEQRVKRTFTDHPGVIRGHTHLADGAEASIVPARVHSVWLPRSPATVVTVIRSCSGASPRPLWPRFMDAPTACARAWGAPCISPT